MKLTDFTAVLEQEEVVGTPAPAPKKHYTLAQLVGDVSKSLTRAKGQIQDYQIEAVLAKMIEKIPQGDFGTVIIKPEPETNAPPQATPKQQAASAL